MNIVITGASRGIGYQLPFAFSELLNTKETHQVFVLSRNKNALDSLKREIESACKHIKVTPVKFDMEKNNKLTFLKKGVKIDVLINNAGAILNKPFKSITQKELVRTYNVNVFGVFKLIQQLLPYFNKNAHIVNISSMGGFMGSVKFPGLSAYSSSKGALTTLSECLAEELRPKDIAVNCLCIGAVNTEMLAKAFPGYKAPVNANQMADYIASFSLNAHKYMNGKVIPVSLSTP